MTFPGAVGHWQDNSMVHHFNELGTQSGYRAEGEGYLIASES